MTTLADIADQLKRDNEDQLEVQLEIATTLDDVFDTLYELTTYVLDYFKETLQMQQMARLAQLEMLREQQVPPIATPDNNSPSKKDGLDSNWYTLLAGIGVIAAGLVAGWAKSIASIDAVILKGIASLNKSVKGFFVNVRSWFNNLAKTMKGAAISGVAAVKSSLSKAFAAIATKIKTMLSGLGKLTGFTAVREAIKETRALFNKTTGIVAKFFKGMKEVAEKVGGWFSGMKGMFGTFMKLGSRIVLPLVVLYDTLKAAFGAEGGPWEKVMAGAEGLLRSLLANLVTIPLDLIKSLVSWIAGKLGFDQIEGALDSFKFEDIGNKIFDSLLAIGEAYIDIYRWIARKVLDMLPRDWIPEGLASFAYKTRGMGVDESKSTSTTVDSNGILWGGDVQVTKANAQMLVEKGTITQEQANEATTTIDKQIRKDIATIDSQIANLESQRTEASEFGKKELTSKIVMLTDQRNRLTQILDGKSAKLVRSSSTTTENAVIQSTQMVGTPTVAGVAVPERVMKTATIVSGHETLADQKAAASGGASIAAVDNSSKSISNTAVNQVVSSPTVDPKNRDDIAWGGQ